jgi:hypothetical protein
MIIDELFEAPQMCPECGGISFSDLILAEKKDACYHKVKASAKVWPSAYASGRLVQCRKKGAANYGKSKNESVRDPNEIGGANSMRQKLGNIIKQAVQDDEVAYNASKLYRELWNIYGGDIDAIIAERSIFELQQLARELVSVGNQSMAEGQLESNTPDPVVVVQDLKGNILDKINLSVAAQKYKLGQPQNIKNQLAHQNYTKIGNYTIVSPMSGQPQDATTQGVAETELDEKSVSQAQFRTMAGAAHNPEFARKVGISQDVAKEFNQADKKSNYKKLPDRATEGEQQKGADYRDPKEVDYDDEYDAMVARVKKLAGLGPMKTTYDPAKRQYRNMPTAQQPKK